MRLVLACAVASLALLLSATAVFAAEPPPVGKVAPDFELATPDGKQVKLSDLSAKGPLVLIMLRGYPGYQCPLCTRQVGSLIAAADQLAVAKASVLMIYPGPAPADELNARAREFLKDIKLPSNFHFVTDAGYRVTNLYGLRWDAPKETAYPSTFVLDRDRTVHLSKISRTHGDRAKTEDVLAAVRRLSR